jgi:hypothetical protein
MVGQLDAIRKTVEHPDRVQFDALATNGENYYRRGVLQHPYDIDYLKVVVRLEPSSTGVIGIIISAYPVDDWRKRGERFKWNR